MSIRLYNIQHQGVVHTPLLVIHGESTFAKSGVLTVSHQRNAYPPLYFEVNHGFFKAVIRLEDGNNDLLLTHSSGNVANGFPQFSQAPAFQPGVVALTINYQPLRDLNRPVHFCLLVAKDSPALFDSTSMKKQFEGNGIDVALKKLRVGGRLMQAFTNEQMLRAGFGNRTFNFYEEVSKESEFYQEISDPKPRHNIKIHVLKSDKTLKELRDPNIAQQNKDGTDTGALFGIANDALNKYGGPFSTGEPVQAAVMFLDTHWDNQLKLILTHAALGGNIGNTRLAIFGSHGLYSWPTYLEQVIPCFQDTTRSDIKEVANDCNECSSYWECLNVTLGAYMHEIGHLLGCPHQTSGVMLRDYVTLNRSFVTRETACVRTNSSGLNPVLPKDECTWHRLDKLRFLFHPSFGLPSDVGDPSFGKQNAGSGGATFFPIGNDQAVIKSKSGIYAIEIYAREIADAFIEYLPVSLGGRGVQYEVTVNSHDLKRLLPSDKQNVNDFKIKVLCIDGQDDLENVINNLSTSNSNKNFFTIDGAEINRQGSVSCVKPNGLGRFDASKQEMVFFDPNTITSIRVYHGLAVDGIRVNFVKGVRSNGGSGPPPVPPRNYSLSSTFKKMFIKEENQHQQPLQDAKQTGSQSQGSNRQNCSVLLGKQTNNYTDVPFDSGDSLKSFNLKTGAWIDSIQIITAQGKLSQHFGNTNGGGLRFLETPNDQYQIVGLWGSTSRWLDSIGIVYCKK